VRIVLGIANVNGEVAGVKFYVFVAGNVLHRNVTGGDAKIQVAIFGKTNSDVKVVARAAAEAKFGRAVQERKDVLHVFDLVSILPGNIHRDLVVVGTEDIDIAGPHVEPERDFGGEGRLEVGLADFADDVFGVGLGASARGLDCASNTQTNESR